MAKVGSVLVVGGGVAGIQASLDLSELGYKVYLIENNPSIGGIMGQLDKTFPTLDCSMCILAPKMVEVGRDPNIELITYSQVEKVEGQAGNFEVTLLKKARYIDADKCKACGICHEHCPVAVKDEYNMGLGIRTAIYTPFPQAVPSTYVVDKQTCLYLQDGICQICEKVCEVGAVDHNQKDEQVKINVGAIILAVGTDTFDPSILPQYGYGKIKNVVTSIEFEMPITLIIASVSISEINHCVRTISTGSRILECPISCMVKPEVNCDCIIIQISNIDCVIVVRNAPSSTRWNNCWIV